MTVEEMEAEMVRMNAHLIWLCDDAIAEITEELKTEKNRYMREWLIEDLEWHRERKKRFEEERSQRHAKQGLGVEPV